VYDEVHEPTVIRKAIANAVDFRVSCFADGCGSRGRRSILLLLGFEMITTVLIIAVACLLPVIFIAVTRGRSSTRLSLGDLGARMRPVDIEAFCNLVDPEEEYFLRCNLPAPVFRSVHRERLLAATQYVAAVSHNATILLRVGEAARHHAEPEVVRAGNELANHAVRLRLHCLLVLLKMWGAIVFPGADLSFTPLVERYQRLSGLAYRLGHLTYPSKTSEISVAR
jgi:hypothetical protein